MDDEPAWISETTWEWEALPGQRYPGDITGRRHAGYRPVVEASTGDGRFGRPPEPRRPASDGRPQPADRRMQPPATDVPHFDLPGDRRAGTAPPPPRQTPPSYVDVRRGPASTGGPGMVTRQPGAVRADSAPTSGWFATRPRSARPQAVPAKDPEPAEAPAQPADDGFTWTISAGGPAEITGEIVTGEIVDGHAGDGEVIRAEVVATGPALVEDGGTPSAAVDHNLGWRLRMSGLGRPTAGPRPMIAAAPDLPRGPVAGIPIVSIVERHRPDWLEGTTAAHLVVASPEPGCGNGSARRQGDQTEQHERRLADPEQLLAAYHWRLDPETLRELVSNPDQLRAVRDRLTDKLEYAERDAVRARLLSLRAVVSRLLGDLEPAVADGRAALGHAEATGELRRTAIAAARLAHVLQWRGEYAEADRLFAEANSIELPDRLRAEMHELAGRSAYEQGRYLEALQQFEAALSPHSGTDTDRTARVAVALDAIVRGARERGWGPYPRTREEILMRYRGPQPFCDVRTGLWGYAGAVPARYRDAQPFTEGAAWIRRPGAHTWELIGEDGRTLIDSSAGYLGVTGFCGGLAWVSREPVGGWFAIDQQNRVIIPGGFEDVRPFHRGVAPVRQGGWGAIDRHGRMVVPPKYRAFVTMLPGGRRVEGFTSEGLAVADAGDRLGVVDQRGRVVVTPAYAALVIHPVAFLVGDHRGRWGALDRRGEPLIDVVHACEADVTHAIDRLLADTRPVL